MPRKKQAAVTLSTGTVIPKGGLVCYYVNGWRTGYLEEITGATVKIRPIKPGAKVRLVTVAIDDLKEMT